MGALSNRWAEWRNRRLADPEFRRRLQGLPGLRGIARRRAGRLFDVTAGFVNSQVLAACLQLDLFERLRGQPLSADDLAAELDLPRDRLLRLLEAAAALELLEHRRADRWGLGPQGAVLASDPGLLAMSRHHAALYADLAEPLTLLRGEAPTQLSRFWPYADSDQPGAIEAGDTRAYTELMAASQRMIAEQVLDAYDFGGHRELLDIGGGNGTFLAAIGDAYPTLALALLDLPGVAAQAEERLAERGLSDRARVHGGDFHRDPLPGAPDLASLVRILHDHDDEPAQALLQRIHDALPPGGTLLIAEPMPPRRGFGGTLGNYFRFYLMAMGSGRPRTPAEVKRMLRRAGFARVKRHRTTVPLVCSVITAHRKDD